MGKTAVASIIRRHGKWIKARDLVDLVAKKKNESVTQAYRDIKEEYEEKRILKHVFSDRAVIYGLPEFGPPTLESGNVDYVRLLEHSKRLIFSDDENQRIDLMHPRTVIDLLAYPEEHEEWLDIQCVEQHVRTGYRRLHRLFQKYRKAKLRSSPSIVRDQPDELRDLLEKGIRKMMDEVKLDNRLRGYCKYCRDCRITIRDKS